MSKNLYIAAISLVALVFVSSRRLAADQVDHSAALAPFVNDDTFAVAYVDLGAMKDSENKSPATLLSLLPKLSDDGQAATGLLLMVDGFVQRFQNAGGKSLYAVAGLRDIYIDGGPLVVATIHPGKRPDELEKLFRDVISQVAGNSPSSGGQSLSQRIQVQTKSEVVLVGTKSTIARYGSLKPSSRADLIEPLTKLSGEGAVAAVVFSPGPDFRRVVREMWPELPGSLASLKGELADRWLRLEFAANLPPDVKPRLTMIARDTEAAQTFAKLWQSLPQATTEFGGNERNRELRPGVEELGASESTKFSRNDRYRERAKSVAQLIVSLLPVTVEGTRVEIGMPTEPAKLAKLHTMFHDAFNASMESSRRRERVNQFKQIALAMLNYYDTKKSLPPAAIRDKEGRPLLSWRVAVLPYIDENRLYKQFKLDEPWDSPHNIKLLSAMPSAYADPALSSLARQGKTTYQVPLGPETVFHKNEGTTMKEIADGTSNTILVVEVEPNRAVPWTKPEDWEVDLQHPRQGVARSDGKPFVAARCDGSVQTIPSDADEARLRAALTRAGREVGENHF